MASDHEILLTLYKKLLHLYPRAFREQLSESMEQTFSDLYNEKRQRSRVLLGFVLWLFIETAIGILREHLLLIKEGKTMRNILTSFSVPAIVSFLLVLPFIILEVINRRQFNEGFPIALFGMIWLLPAIFIRILMPIVRSIRVESSIMTKPIQFCLSVTILVLIAIVWTGTLIDQMPCFLGVPNCD